MPDLSAPNRRDTDPTAYAWPAWATNIRSAGAPTNGWAMEINGYMLNVPLFGRVSMNSLPELYRFALQIDVWDAEQVVHRRRARLDEAVGASGGAS